MKFRPPSHTLLFPRYSSFGKSFRVLPLYGLVYLARRWFIASLEIPSPAEHTPPLSDMYFFDDNQDAYQLTVGESYHSLQGLGEMQTLYYYKRKYTYMLIGPDSNKQQTHPRAYNRLLELSLVRCALPQRCGDIHSRRISTTASFQRTEP